MIVVYNVYEWLYSTECKSVLYNTAVGTYTQRNRDDSYRLSETWPGIGLRLQRLIRGLSQGWALATWQESELIAELVTNILDLNFKNIKIVFGYKQRSFKVKILEYSSVQFSSLYWQYHYKIHISQYFNSSSRGDTKHEALQCNNTTTVVWYVAVLVINIFITASHLFS